MKQKRIEMKGETDKSTVIVGDLNIPFSATDRRTRQKNQQEYGTQQDQIDIYRTLHPITHEYTFFSSADGTYSKMNHITGHQTI